MEYMPSDLNSLIHSDTYLSEIQIKKIMYNLLSAICYLHSKGVVHRDLKPGNVLINKDC